VTVEVSR